MNERPAPVASSPTSSGGLLTRDAMLRTVQAADMVGLKAMLTHAKDDEVKAFYMAFGFEPSPTNKLHLMLNMKDIRASLLNTAVQ